MNARTPTATARAISSFVLATPLNTICRGSNPTASAFSSSPPALTSTLLARVPHHVQEPEVGARLAGVEHLGGGVPAAERVGHRLDVGAQAALAEHEEGCRAIDGQLDQVDTVEAQVPVADGVERIG